MIEASEGGTRVQKSRKMAGIRKIESEADITYKIQIEILAETLKFSGKIEFRGEL